MGVCDSAEVTWLKRTGLGLIVWLGIAWANPAHAAPSSEALASILGYPAGELVVEDVTAAERELWATPNGKERRSGVMESPPPQKLRAAYRIGGRDPRTFNTIIVYVADEGALLTEKVSGILGKIAEAPAKPISKGGRGPLGPMKFDGASAGGIYLQEMKRPSTLKVMTEPGNRTALISVVRLADPQLEIQVAVMAGLDEGTELMPIKGGEDYYQRFGPEQAEDASPEIAVNLFSGITREIVATSLPDSAGRKPRPTRGGASDGGGGKAEVLEASGERGAGSVASGSAYWIWVVGAVGIVGVGCWAVVKNRR
ncbi:hypothetical protein [Haloferula sp. BvORR071]|uniref:hypothetical protein n=1 Tax=Haloferula sp. BvORR071 TaxID=1396141 RepID=UPI00055749A3|nr:hypothetical protein [Haloferula sp. BvORR071]